ncbi:cysteine peptidase family C39 domain-containing protein [Thiomicrorhabdus sp. Kp2]|uniref:cysteine peptidase family C39 domain-containing protein n=1 Tax=Thiomicrorhabdus sp. Kp2 TaxID=1123518 RepID=UPI000593EF91|nr:cysteine peptidase family C39 domain-containing protein [Thiomicrorhabdus sp. Kp2]
MDSGIGCVQLISRFYGVAADAMQLQRQYVKPTEKASSMDVVRMIKSLGLKSRQIKSSAEKILKSPLPAIAQDHHGEFFIMKQSKG